MYFANNFLKFLPEPTLLEVVPPKRRGRPRIKKTIRLSLSSQVEEILKGPSYPLELVTTKVGGMQAAFEHNCYEYHFNRNGYKFWKCVHHKTGCQSKIVSKDGLVYPFEREHNHETQNIELIPTTNIVNPKVSQEPIKNVVLNVGGQSNTDGAKATHSTSKSDFKSKLNERFAALSQKLPLQKSEKLISKKNT